MRKCVLDITHLLPKLARPQKNSVSAGWEMSDSRAEEAVVDSVNRDALERLAVVGYRYVWYVDESDRLDRAFSNDQPMQPVGRWRKPDFRFNP